MSQDEKQTEPMTFRVKGSVKRDLELISRIYNFTLADLLRDLVDKGIEVYFRSEEIEKKAEEQLSIQEEVTRQIKERAAHYKK